MARDDREKRSFKFGQPLFACAWPHGDVLFIGGGGGRAKTGIENRIVAARYQAGAMTDEVGSVQLPDACQHLLFLPKTRLLIAALRTGVVGYSIEEHEDRVHFIAPPTQIVERLRVLDGEEVTAMATDASGAVLALGTAAGRVSIWRCSDLTLLFGSDKLAAAGLPRDSEVKCVAFGGRRAGALELAASFDSGEAHCAALRVAAEGESVAEPSVVDCKVTREAGTLRKPPGCENAALKHCRFARCSDDSDALVCTLNYKGSGWVARWAQQPDGSYAFGRKSRAFPNALTSMQTGSTPTRVAIGSSDGEVYILDAESLAVMQQDRKAHMVFATAVAVAADGHAAVSTSGDASARVTELAGGGGSGMCGTFTCVMLLLALAVAVWLAAQHREDLMLLTQSGREMVEKRVLETEAAELERPVEL